MLTGAKKSCTTVIYTETTRPGFTFEKSSTYHYGYPKFFRWQPVSALFRSMDAYLIVEACVHKIRSGSPNQVTEVLLRYGALFVTASILPGFTDEGSVQLWQQVRLLSLLRPCNHLLCDPFNMGVY
jgi:hypothetical protein